MDLIERLRALIELTGPSGQEEDIVRFLRRALEGLADDLVVDPLGNLIAHRKGSPATGKRLLISAHLDEIGFIVQKIEANGFLRFEKVGGHDDRVLLGRRIWVRGMRQRILGVIGCKSAHLTAPADRERVIKHTDMYVDVGAATAEAARAMGVSVGDPMGLVGELAEVGLDSGRFIGKSLDDRAGCALLWHLLDELRGAELPGDLYAVFSVQEEVGLRGARTAAQAIQPDVALALDMTAADDTPDTGTGHLALGHGPAIKVMDNSFISHPAIRRALIAAAERTGVGVQLEILTGIGTDAGALHQAGPGVPTGCLSIVNRYTHSSIEMLDRRDLDGAFRVLKEFVTTLTDVDLSFAPS